MAALSFMLRSLCCPSMGASEFFGDGRLDRIEEGLYLGTLDAACDIETVSGLNVTHILTVASQPLPQHTVQAFTGRSSLFYIKVYDDVCSDLLSHFQDAVDFIKQGQNIGTVLVHCLCGVSRSSTLVTCYLMNKYNITRDKALKRVQKRRSCAVPNRGFMDQLLLYQTMGCQLNTSHLQYKLYLLHTVGSVLTKDYERKVDAKYRVIFQPDPTSLTSLPSPAYRCQNCRSPLISEDALIPHYPNETPDWRDGKWSERLQKDSNSSSSSSGMVSGRLKKDSNSSSNRKWSGRLEKGSNSSSSSGMVSGRLKKGSNSHSSSGMVCDKGVFTFPIAWMEKTLGEELLPGPTSLRGRLTCPICQHCIGHYDWLQGYKCECKAKITPGFYFIPSRLEKY
ncbi:hypothetical protein Pmani_035641 [Petrolisthes manimaculis]|uniref:Protein-tyrosine-phosphatase n=1 Tax=Petrolisthes manimaculis TaxID=1843537 RepID=A0AAE1TNH6_9EUCA|nr:hypothetical protein Pmani_035641 [Petrolisthes manimaculis]